MPSAHVVFPTYKEIRYIPTYTNVYVVFMYIIYQQAPFSPEILNAIRSAGFSTPSPIQAQCWPYLAAKHDLVAVAKTGSGKVFFAAALHVCMLVCMSELLSCARIHHTHPHMQRVNTSHTHTHTHKSWHPAPTGMLHPALKVKKFKKKTPDMRVPAACLDAHPQGHSRT